MAEGNKSKRWNSISFADGCKVIRVGSWQGFNDLFYEKLINLRHFIWRGHTDSDWPLEPTLDRILNVILPENRGKAREDHLERFRMAARGRRGPFPSKPTEDELWSLGRHYGLATPFLDWTRSPFVAAFFALIEQNTSSRFRAVWGLTSNVLHRSDEIRKEHKGVSRAPIIEFIDPKVDDNPRLVSQGGLFTRSPDGVDIQNWVSTYFKDDKKTRLFKILIPDSERELALRALNRMNINHLSLFPDLTGACEYANSNLLIAEY